MKRTLLEKLGDFVLGKGFYIVLFLCVAAIGISGYYLFSDMSEQGKTVSGPAQVVVTPTPRPTLSSPNTPQVTLEPPSVATPRPVPTPAPPPVATPAPQPTPAPLPSAPATATASVFTWPVKGEVLREHAVETLAYDKTMGDWRTHDGIDIQA